MGAPSEATRELPWWLEPGVEECEFCLQAVHYEAFYFCTECDAPVCPACTVAVYERRITICPRCHSEGPG